MMRIMSRVLIGTLLSLCSCGSPALPPKVEQKPPPCTAAEQAIAHSRQLHERGELYAAVRRSEPVSGKCLTPARRVAIAMLNAELGDAERAEELLAPVAKAADSKTVATIRERIAAQRATFERNPSAMHAMLEAFDAGLDAAATDRKAAVAHFLRSWQLWRPNGSALIYAAEAEDDPLKARALYDRGVFSLERETGQRAEPVSLQTGPQATASYPEWGHNDRFLWLSYWVYAGAPLRQTFVSSDQAKPHGLSADRRFGVRYDPTTGMATIRHAASAHIVGRVQLGVDLSWEAELQVEGSGALLLQRSPKVQRIFRLGKKIYEHWRTHCAAESCPAIALLSPNGHWALVAEADELMIFDTRTAKRRVLSQTSFVPSYSSLPFHMGSYSAVGFSPDSQTIAIASEDTVSLVATDTGAVRRDLVLPAEILALRFLRDGMLSVAVKATEGANTHIFDPTTGTQRALHLAAMWTAGGDLLTLPDDSEDGPTTAQLPGSKTSFSLGFALGPVSFVDRSRNGRVAEHVATGSTLSLYPADAEKIVHTLHTYFPRLHELAVAEDTAVVAFGDGQARAWTLDLSTAQTRIFGTPQDCYKEHPQVAISANAKYVAATVCKGVTVWDTSTKAEMVHIEEATRVAFIGSALAVATPDGAVAYSFASGTAKRKAAKTKHIRAQIVAGKNCHPRCLGHIPSSHDLAVSNIRDISSRGGTTLSYQSGRKLIARRRGKSTTLTAPKDIYGAAISPEGIRVALRIEDEFAVHRVSTGTRIAHWSFGGAEQFVYLTESRLLISDGVRDLAVVSAKDGKVVGRYRLFTDGSAAAFDAKGDFTLLGKPNTLACGIDGIRLQWRACANRQSSSWSNPNVLAE